MSTILAEYLIPQTVRLQAIARERDQAIDLAGKLLLGTGCIQVEYIQAIKDLFQDAGPYMVITPGVAMLHARPENGALSECMSLVTLKKAIPFGHADNDPVDLVFAFAAGNKDEHLKVMSALAKLLNNSESMAKIRKAKHLKTLISVIKESG